MVTNPQDLQDIDLYRNPNSGRFIGRDPDSGDLFAIPFEEISVNRYVNQRIGFFDSHLNTTQTSAENGLYVNFAEVTNVNRGFSVNSNSSIDVNNDGTYEVEFSVNFHRTGSGARNIMYAEVELNGTNLSQRSRGVCYIRNDGNGDEGDATGSVVMDLTAGDTIRVYAGEERGAETGNDIERASVNIKRLG